MKLISRDCCPYLDDFEPDYPTAVAAVASTGKRATSWDPLGPTFDEPTPAVILIKLPDGGSVAAEARHSAQEWPDSDDDEPPPLLESPCDSDPGEDSPDPDNTDFFGFIYKSNRMRHDHHARTDAAYQAAPGISSPRDGSWWWDDTTESDWTVVGQINPHPIKLSPKGVEDIFARYLSQVEMAPPIDPHIAPPPPPYGGLSRLKLACPQGTMRSSTFRMRHPRRKLECPLR